jgi:hypothetical protein
MTLFRTSLFTLTVLFGLTSVAVHAEMDASMDKMCAKIKSCGLIELENQGLSEDMQDMMVGMFDGMCKTMFAKHMKTVGQEGLEDKAEACIDSMVAASCEELLSVDGDFRTDQCDEFEKAAEAAGVDLK